MSMTAKLVHSLLSVVAIVLASIAIMISLSKPMYVQNDIHRVELALARDVAAKCHTDYAKLLSEGRQLEQMYKDKVAEVDKLKSAGNDKGVSDPVNEKRLDQKDVIK